MFCVCVPHKDFTNMRRGDNESFIHFDRAKSAVYWSFKDL